MRSSTDILTRIVAQKHIEVAGARARLPLPALRELALAAPGPRGFRAAMQGRMASGEAAVIAEIKRSSPSKGLLREDFRPVEIALDYAAAGACCLSVLTDTQFFGGTDDDLRQVRATVELPVLRKDFIVDPYQVYEARALGADCVLLIVAILDDDQLYDLHALALSLGLDVLVEVHDAAELQRASTLGPHLLGVNNRNLRSFETRLDTTLELRDRVPAGVPLISESGIRDAGDIGRLRTAGVQGFLVGETLMRAPHPGKALRALLGSASQAA